PLRVKSRSWSWPEAHRLNSRKRISRPRGTRPATLPAEITGAIEGIQEIIEVARYSLRPTPRVARARPRVRIAIRDRDGRAENPIAHEAPNNERKAGQNYTRRASVAGRLSRQVLHHRCFPGVRAARHVT